jgi:hypothetical protein
LGCSTTIWKGGAVVRHARAGASIADFCVAAVELRTRWHTRAVKTQGLFTGRGWITYLVETEVVDTKIVLANFARWTRELTWAAGKGTLAVGTRRTGRAVWIFVDLVVTIVVGTIARFLPHRRAARTLITATLAHQYATTDGPATITCAHINCVFIDIAIAIIVIAIAGVVRHCRLRVTRKLTVHAHGCAHPARGAAPRPTGGFIDQPIAVIIE